jgi:YggT family protein
MMVNIFIQVIDIVAQVLILVVVADAVVSFFLPPYHQVRVALDRLVEPMLSPIRRVVPPFQTFDFSPIILILLIQLLEVILKSVFNSLG